MTVIEPQGEHLRKAVKWISGEQGGDAARPLTRLIEEACLRFNLSPKEEAFLTHFFCNQS